MQSEFGGGSIWAQGMNFFSAARPINDLLEKEGFTLEQLLDEDDLLQEVKGMNDPLIKFLSDRPQVSRLIHFITVPPSADAGEKEQRRYPHVACEIISSEVPVLLDRLTSPEDDFGLLRQLFGILDQPAPLDARLAGFFAKVVRVLCVRCQNELLAFLHKSTQAPQLLPRLLRHIGNDSILAVTQALLTVHPVDASETTSRAGSVRSATKLPPPKYPSAEPLQLLGLPTWLEAAEVAPAPGADGADGAGAGAARPAKMVAAVLQLMLDPAQSHDVHHNAGELLKMVVQWAPNRGLPILEDSGLTLVQATLSMGQEGEDSSAVVEEDTEPSAPVSQLRGDVAGRWSVGALLRAANSAEAPSARDAAVAVLLALLERVNSPAPSSASASAPSAPRLMAVVPCLVDSLSELCAPLHVPPDAPQGMPLGRHRLALVRLLRALLAVGSVGVLQAFHRERALAPCLYWFFALPNHSLLHHEVTAMLAPLLRGATGAAAGDLAHDCALRGATLALQEQLLVELELPQRVAAVLQGVDLSTPRALWPGHMGYLYRISECLKELGDAAEAPAAGRCQRSASEEWESVPETAAAEGEAEAEATAGEAEGEAAEDAAAAAGAASASNDAVTSPVSVQRAESQATVDTCDSEAGEGARADAGDEAETEARIVAALKSEQWQHTLTETLPVLARATHQPLAGGRPIAPEELAAQEYEQDRALMLPEMMQALNMVLAKAQAERGYSDGEFDIHGSISDSSDDSSDDEESGEARQRALRQRYGLDMDFEGADEEGQRAYAQMFTAGFSDLDDMEMEHGVGEVRDFDAQWDPFKLPAGTQQSGSGSNNRDQQGFADPFAAPFATPFSEPFAATALPVTAGSSASGASSGGADAFALSQWAVMPADEDMEEADSFDTAPASGASAKMEAEAEAGAAAGAGSAGHDGAAAASADAADEEEFAAFQAAPSQPAPGSSGDSGESEDA